MNNRHNEDMYRLYEEYEESLRIAKKTRNKRQKINREIRETKVEPYKRKDHLSNVNDITNWNSMIRDLEEDMKEMELYLDFKDRTLLHREYNNVKSMILNQNSYEGEVPFDTLYGESIPDTTEIICSVETQEYIVELLDNVLTERQKKIIYMYFWNDMTQDEIGREIGIAQKNVHRNIENSLKTLQEHINLSEVSEILTVRV